MTEMEAECEAYEAALQNLALEDAKPLSEEVRPCTAFGTTLIVQQQLSTASAAVAHAHHLAANRRTERSSAAPFGGTGPLRIMQSLCFRAPFCSPCRPRDGSPQWCTLKITESLKTEKTHSSGLRQ